MDLPDRSRLFAAYRRSIRAAAAGGLTKLNPAVVDIEGSDLNVLGGANSLMGEEAVGDFSDCIAGLFAGTALGAALDKVIFDKAGGQLPRLAASPATIDVVFSRPTPGAPTAGTYPAGGRFQFPGGIVFATDVDAVFGAFSTSVALTATAIVAGPGGNVPKVPPAPAASFMNAPFDPTITIANSSAAGGADVEDDVAYRGRYFNFFPTIRRGVLGAIQVGAQKVPGVAVATAIEVVNPSDGFPAAIVLLIIADANGNSSAGLAQKVTDSLITFRAAGIQVVVQGGLLDTSTAIVWKLAFDSGINTVLAAQQVRAVTAAVTQFLAPGARLYRSTLIAAAKTIPGVIVADDSLVAPVGDVVPVDPITLQPDSRRILRVLPQNVSFV